MSHPAVPEKIGSTARTTLTLAVLLAFLLALAGTVLYWPETDNSGPDQASTTDSTKSLIARGEYLARIGNCGHCHSARGGAPFAGGRALDTPFGTIYTSNLTPDRERGLGAWSADDFWRALHFGIGKDQRVLNPAFPYTSYSRINRSDANALFAYLQSLPAASTLNRASELRWPYNSQLALRVWRKLYFRPFDSAAASASEAASQSTTPHDAAWQRGEYLVQGLGHCMECHAPRNALGALQTASAERGGVLPGSLWYAPSLSQPNEASVAAWSSEATVRFLSTGIGPAGFASGPMAEVVLHGTQYLQPQDAAAMARYLQSLQASPSAQTQAVANAPIGQASDLQSAGKALYEKHCSSCHQSDGSGQPGAYPALAGNRNITLSNSSNLIHLVLRGGFAPATAGNPRPFGMPPFMLLLNDEEVTQVLNYVRFAFAPAAATPPTPVSAVDVNHLRRAQLR